MNKFILVLTAVLGALGIILGAFGAHALKERLAVEALQNFETGVRYQMYHVFAILLVAAISQLQNGDKNWIAILFVIGIVFFSGSLYAISAGGVNPKSIWFITPLGGLFFIIGWLLLAYKFFRL